MTIYTQYSCIECLQLLNVERLQVEKLLLVLRKRSELVVIMSGREGTVNAACLTSRNNILCFNRRIVKT